jgi:hypothetical protein
MTAFRHRLRKTLWSLILLGCTGVLPSEAQDPSRIALGKVANNAMVSFVKDAGGGWGIDITLWRCQLA